MKLFLPLLLVGVSSLLGAATGLKSPSAKSLPLGASKARGLQVMSGFDSVGSSLVGSVAASQFGIGVAVDPTGTLLLVGANNDDSVNTDGGSIALYEFPFTSDPIWSTFGDEGDNIGELFSTSESLERIAFPSGDSVVVVELPSGSQLGSTISCQSVDGGAIIADNQALSPNGNILAVTCRTAGGTVEIYQWSDTSSDWELRGDVNSQTPDNDLFGFCLSITDSSRLLVTSPNYDENGAINVGLMEVFDYDGSSWNPLGNSIVGLAARDQLGFSCALSDDGSTAVVSAPNAASLDVSGALFVGHVVAFSYNSGSSTWTQNGQTIEGQAGDRLGRALQISPSGDTLVASSWRANSQLGQLLLLAFDGNSNTWEQSAVVDGVLINERLGFGRNGLSLRGPYLAVGSTQAGKNPGRALVLEQQGIILDPTELPSESPSSVPSQLPTSAPTQSPTNAPSDAPSGSPSSSPSASLTGSPTLIPSASPTGAPTAPTLQSSPTIGSTTNPTVSPSSAPTMLPTMPFFTTSPTSIPTSSPTSNGSTSASPTVAPTRLPTADTTSTPTPTGTPTVTPTLGPTALPTKEPTADPSGVPTQPPSVSGAPTSDAVLGKFDYDILRVGDVAVRFAQETDNEEVVLNYLIHRRQAMIQTFQEDCQTAVASDVIEVFPTVTVYNSSHNSFEIALDIKQEEVVGSPIFNISGPETGTLGLCLRVDLLSADGNSVVFHEQKLFAFINLVNEFSIERVDLARIEPDLVEQSADLEYGVTAFQCNDQFQPDDSVLSQNSIVLICIKTATENIQIDSIRSLTLQQGGLTKNGIADGQVDEFTEILFPTFDRKLAVIQTRLVSAFFELQDPEPVLASGTLALTFTGDESGNVRRLRASIASLNSRELETSTEQDATYDVMLEVGSNDSSGSVAQVSTVVAGALVGVLALLI